MSLGPRARRAVAAVGVVLFLVVYVWAVITLGARLPSSPWIALIYYGVAGLAWGLPLLPLLAWAEGGGKGRAPRPGNPPTKPLRDGRPRL